jgi:hypothetical protein
MSAPDLRTAALAVIEATDKLRDAMNGQGHPGEAHDQMFHQPPAAGDSFEIFSDSTDCCACAGAQYGCDITLSDAIGDLRAALGQERKPWECTT